MPYNSNRGHWRAANLLQNPPPIPCNSIHPFRLGPTSLTAMSTESSQPHTVPPFECQLPPGLLEGRSDIEKHLYTSIDEIKQAVRWSANLSAATANRMNEITTEVKEIRRQTTATNGRVLAAEVALKETVPVVRVYHWGRQAVKTKVFWATAGIFLFVVVPFLIEHAPVPRQALSMAAKWVLGM